MSHATTCDVLLCPLGIWIGPPCVQSIYFSAVIQLLHLDARTRTRFAGAAGI